MHEMSRRFRELKSEILRLLKEDEEFRYAVAGLIGLEEILKRLDRHEEELVKLREDMNKLREDMNKLREDMNRLREDMNRGFRRYDKILEKHWSEIVRLRGEMNKLREDMNRGFESVNRLIAALGARWGIMSEEAFREGLRGLLEKEFGWKIERWIEFDDAGFVYGYPSQVEIDVVVKDSRLILIEVSSHIKPSDVYEFKRKAEFYRKKTGKEPNRLIMVSPFVEDRALKVARELGVEIYTKV